MIVILAFLTPIIACVVFGLLQGQWIGNYYLPSSQWNDELLYFKQVEGVVEYGYPQGFFGYNESNAEKLTFSAWSPIIIVIYVLWGKIFGWSMQAPMICNVLLICAGLAFFAYKAKLEYKQLGLLGGFVILFIPLSRFMLSCMADCEIIFILMIYMGFYVGESKAKDFAPSAGGIIGMLVCSIFLTLMRPYFLLLFIFPGYLMTKRKKWGIFVVLGIIGLTMILYAYISQNFMAPYFFPLIDTDWIKTIFSDPFYGIKNAIKIFVYGLSTCFSECVSGIMKGNMEGGFWCFFALLLLLLTCLSIKEKQYRIWVAIMVALFGAIIMFYDIHVGSRHLMPFIFMVVLLLCCSKYQKTCLGMLAAVLFLFTCRLQTDEYNYNFPAYDKSRAETIAVLQANLSEEIVIEESKDYWDNTVIWLFRDETMLNWQNLYALPAGMGINLCMPDYVIENIDGLKAKYIAVNTGEGIDLLFAQLQAKKITEQDGLTIWQLRE